MCESREKEDEFSHKPVVVAVGDYSRMSMRVFVIVRRLARLCAMAYDARWTECLTTQSLVDIHQHPGHPGLLERAREREEERREQEYELECGAM